MIVMKININVCNEIIMSIIFNMNNDINEMTNDQCVCNVYNNSNDVMCETVIILLVIMCVILIMIQWPIIMWQCVILII